MASDAEPDLVEWLERHELSEARDLRFAFTSEAQASAAGGSQVAEAWKFAQAAEGPPSGWALWVAPRVLQEAARPPAPPPPSVPGVPACWRGVRPRAEDRSDQPSKDAAKRRAAAEEALDLALSWGAQGKLAQEAKALAGDRLRNWKLLQIERLMAFEAGSVRARMRAWTHTGDCGASRTVLIT